MMVPTKKKNSFPLFLKFGDNNFILYQFFSQFRLKRKGDPNSSAKVILLLRQFLRNIIRTSIKKKNWTY